jgi:hypothetical protein
MRAAKFVVVAGLVGAGVLLSSALAFADRWDVRKEVSEGNREIRRERREAVREIANADSAWEARQEIREAHREISREQREARREVSREIRENVWGW